MNELITNILFIGKGLLVTLPLLFGSLTVGIVLGIGIAIARYQNKAVWILNRLISIVRGTPMILQLAFVYFTAPSLFGIKLSIISAGIIALGINSSAYVAEIFRAGIESIPKGQFEAAQTLAIPTYYTWKDIILPQVIRHIFPAMINEVITLMKDTALISTIGGMDLMRSAQTIAAEQFTYFLPLCIAGGYYYLFVVLVEALGKHVEKRWRHVTT